MINYGKMKKEIFTEALSCSIDVLDKNKNKIAKLIPVGNWALKDSKLLNSFAKWRKTYMNFFFKQFTSSKESMIGYLKNLSIGKGNRIFFAIYVDKTLVGHIGLKNITKNSAELDNIIRGETGGPSNLMLLSEKTLLYWAFFILDLKKVNAKVMSNNLMALNLHEELGFKLKKKYYLKKFQMKKRLFYRTSDKKAATENFFMNSIELSKKDFITVNNFTQS